MRVKMVFEIFHNRGFEVEVAAPSAILNTLCSERDFPQHPQFFATKTKLFTTNLAHFDSQFHDKVMINEGTGWLWEE